MFLRMMSFFVFLSGSVVIFGSQPENKTNWVVHPTKVVVVKIATIGSTPPSRGFFKLANKETRGCCQELGIESKKTDPFIHFTVSSEAQESDEVADEIKRLQGLPAHCFLQGNFFKSEDADIATLAMTTESGKTLFQLQNVNQSWIMDYNSQQFFNFFKERPSYHLTDKEELVRERIITADGAWATSDSFFKRPVFCWLVGSLGVAFIVMLLRKHF